MRHLSMPVLTLASSAAMPAEAKIDRVISPMDGSKLDYSACCPDSGGEMSPHLKCCKQ